MSEYVAFAVCPECDTEGNHPMVAPDVAECTHCFGEFNPDPHSVHPASSGRAADTERRQG